MTNQTTNNNSLAVKKYNDALDKFGAMPTGAVPSMPDAAMDKQKELMQMGLSAYADDRHYDAIQFWTQCMNLSPNTEIGRNAEGYIIVAKAEIKGLESK
jgi:hypothetical protein